MLFVHNTSKNSTDSPTNTFQINPQLEHYVLPNPLLCACLYIVGCTIAVNISSCNKYLSKFYFFLSFSF